METTLRSYKRCCLCGRPFMIYWCQRVGYRIFHGCGKRSGDSGSRYHYDFQFTGPYRNSPEKAERTIPKRMCQRQ